MRRVNSKTRGGVQIFFHAESEREKISVQNQLLAQKVCTKSLRFSSAVKSSAMVIIILHTHTRALSSFDACAQREYLLCAKVVIFFLMRKHLGRSPPRCKKEQFGRRYFRRHGGGRGRSNTNHFVHKKRRGQPLGRANQTNTSSTCTTMNER